MRATSRATVRGAELAYTMRGDGEPMLLLHTGFLADGMAPLVAEPALADFRRIAYHRRGYGASDPTDGPGSMADQASDALGLLDALGIDRAHLVGHSLGADVALQVALDAPERVASLVLMEPLLGFLLSPPAAAFVAETASVALPRFASGDRAGALQAWLSGAFGPGFRVVLDRTLPGAWEQAIADAGTAFGVELPALQEWPLGTRELARIDVPTLSLVHVEDAWPGFEQTHTGLLASIPGCRGTRVALRSHLLQIADPSAVAGPVSAFAAGHPVARG
jgi:pimeloyl-ACP methyl ester carboxylesterase